MRFIRVPSRSAYFGTELATPDTEMVVNVANIQHITEGLYGVNLWMGERQCFTVPLPMSEICRLIERAGAEIHAT